jgi:hypothetical protein
MMRKQSHALIDARLIEDTRFLTRFVEPPCLKRREPVIKPGQMYGTILREAPGQWKRWYLNGRQSKPPMNDIHMRICYATSANGLDWEKPALNLIEAPDKLTPNNALLDQYTRDQFGNDVSGSGGPEGFDVMDAQVTPPPAATTASSGDASWPGRSTSPTAGRQGCAARCSSPRKDGRCSKAMNISST